MDRFAEIANNGINNLKDELKPYVPDKLVPFYIDTTDREVPVLETRTYETNLASFKKDIKALKKRMLPYLDVKVPPKTCNRQSIELKDFRFRYEVPEDVVDFGRVLAGEGAFEDVIIPDYRGPVGRWRGYYQKEIDEHVIYTEQQQIYLRFMAVDYYCQVYWNNRLVCSHEGFFQPFEVDVTDYYIDGGQNRLTVLVENDYPTLAQDYGNGRMEGDKIYAATGYGYDDPKEGWHHCPAGAGICDRMYLEVRDEIAVTDIFVRPDIESDSAEVWVEVTSTIVDNIPFELKGQIQGRNFESANVIDFDMKPQPAGPGVNYYKAKVTIDDMKLWTMDEPYLYNTRISVYRDNCLVDQLDEHFGMRKFHMDETEELKGTLYLNNDPIILRGANTMGHMQQCVYRNDFDQLVEDILIAKYANINFYRLTQRPVQREIYDYCDALGLMLQTDLPLFGWLRRNKLMEGVKQAGDMERHVRSHPSNIMVTYINEPFPESWGYDRGHRSLYRYEMEEFFEMASKHVRLMNPDRVIKNVDGDYDPPTRDGMSDFHCYNMWYTNHCLPIGKLHKGHLPPTKVGWKMGCGEYGVEALDSVDIIMNDYPKEWSPNEKEDLWNPSKIIRSQMYTMHGDWFEEQNSVEDWVEMSQKHQAFSIGMMNDAFRRHTDRMVSTAVHLLIDAWPSGWMKTLVDYKRVPKRAYFVFRETMEPIRVNMRTDKRIVYCGETIELECYSLNDTPEAMKDYKLHVCVMNDSNQKVEQFEKMIQIQPCSGTYQGSVKFQVPYNKSIHGFINIIASLLNEENVLVNQEKSTIKTVKRYGGRKSVTLLKSDIGMEKSLLSCGIDTIISDKALLIVNDVKAFKRSMPKILEQIHKGRDVMITAWDNEGYTIENDLYKVETIGGVGADGVDGKGLTFVVANRQHKILSQLKDKEFSFMYDKHDDIIGFIAEEYIQGPVDNQLLYTYKTPSFGEAISGEKETQAILAERKIGQGILYLSTVRLEPLLGENPYLDELMRAMCKE